MIKKRGVTRTQPVVCKPVAAFCAFTPTLRSMFNVQCSMFNVQRLSSGPYRHRGYRSCRSTWSQPHSIHRP